MCNVISVVFAECTVFLQPSLGPLAVSGKGFPPYFLRTGSLEFLGD